MLPIAPRMPISVAMTSTRPVYSVRGERTGRTSHRAGACQTRSYALPLPTA